MTPGPRDAAAERFRRIFGCNLAWVAAAIALLSGIMALSSGLGNRAGLWNFRAGFSILRYAAVVAAVSLPASMGSLLLSLQQRLWRCAAVSGAALAVACIVVGVPLRWKLAAARVPAIHDISTDVLSPPRFVGILPLRQNAPNPPEYGGPAVAAQQQAAYPDITTKLLDLPADKAFALAAETAKKLGWKIVAQVPAEGRIEATDTTFWFGFTDDIVIRITPAGYRSLVDIRSVSRVGKSDLGTNAARIRKFLRALQPES